jgi:hypothetical protein
VCFLCCCVAFPYDNTIVYGTKYRILAFLSLTCCCKNSHQASECLATIKHSNCIHTRGYCMMASLDDKIAALETEIKEYRMSSRAAKTSEERKSFIDAITESKKTLNILLAQKSQQQGK